jgi:hypothetical protein
MRPLLNMTDEEKLKIKMWKAKFPEGMKFNYYFHDRGTKDVVGQCEFCFSVETQGTALEVQCLVVKDFVVFEG